MEFNFIIRGHHIYKTFIARRGTAEQDGAWKHTQ